jgi:hypothetical protein
MIICLFFPSIVAFPIFFTPFSQKTVTLSQNVMILEQLVQRRTCILQAIEREVLLLCRSEKKRLIGMTKIEMCLEYVTSTKIFDNLGICNGPQERLANMYTQLEDLNDKIEKEQQRRRRVLKRLDQMDSSSGIDDIDYFLAFPFVGDCPDHHKTMGIPNSYVSKDGSDAMEESEASFSRGVQLEDGATFYTNMDDLEKHQKPHLDMNGLTVDSTTPQGNTGEDKKKKPKRPMMAAKQAISRYMHLGFFGIAKQPSKVKSLLFPISSNNGQDFIENHVIEVCDKAFVQMKTFTASTIAMQSMHSSKPGSMVVSAAPEPRDIMWGNIYISKGAKRTRALIGDLVVFILITSYAVPVTLVSLLVSESALIAFSVRLAQLYRASTLFKMAIGMV